MDQSLNVNFPKIVFIGGTGRSGTNITKQLLARHPEVAAHHFEHRFTLDPDGLVDFYSSYSSSWTPYYADRKIKRLEAFLLRLAAESAPEKVIGDVLKKYFRFITPRQYHRWDLKNEFPNYVSHVHELVERLRTFSFEGRWVGSESYQNRPIIYYGPPMGKEALAEILGSFLRVVVRDYLIEKNAVWYVEDNTWNILLAKELNELAPESKLLHIYRDPRDVVASYMKQKWSPKDEVQAATWYRDMMQYWFRVRSELPSTFYYEFSLEGLVHNTNTVISEICEFTGISSHPALFEMKLGKSNEGRWKHDLSPEQQANVTSILKDVIAVLGYE